MDELVVHQVNIAHYRLVELSRLVDQAKPFYDWVEKQARRVSGSHRSLSEILTQCSKDEILQIINACYADSADDRPFLFDGVGRTYPHGKACFYFFAWMIRDAPQQRLSPLVSRMQKTDSISKMTAETDALTELIFEYRGIVRSFEWPAVREVVLDRLEGSRRSISGHQMEAHVRTSLITSLQYYYSIHGNYGSYKQVEIADKQVKIGSHTADVSVDLLPRAGSAGIRLLILVKTRETEGGGHSHLFSRELITAISELNRSTTRHRVIAVIIAENWSAAELDALSTQIDLVFHFDMNPNRFAGFDEDAQITLNRYVASVLGGKDAE